MAVEFFENAPTKVDFRGENLSVTWPDGRRTGCPWEVWLVLAAMVREGRREHDARKAKVARLPRRGRGHAASS